MCRRIDHQMVGVELAPGGGSYAGLAETVGMIGQWRRAKTWQRALDPLGGDHLCAVKWQVLLSHDRSSLR